MTAARSSPSRGNSWKQGADDDAGRGRRPGAGADADRRLSVDDADLRRRRHRRRRAQHRADRRRDRPNPARPLDRRRQELPRDGRLWAVDRHRRRDPGPDAAPSDDAAQRQRGPAHRDRRSDLRHPDPDLVLLGLDAAGGRRRDLDRYAGGGRLCPQAALVDEAGRCRRGRDRRRRRRAAQSDYRRGMKAILLRRPGGPEALEYVEVPTPVPGEGKVLVKADTIGVSMPEVLVRRGTYAWMPPLPAIPGIELSGTVVAHGPNTAEPALGQPVFVSARDLPVRAGCYAEYIAVPARAAHPLPPGCSLEAAACLSNYQVAYHVVHTAARGVEAKRVLVHTAAGGVGSAAVQLALIAGLEVIGVAGSEKKTRAILGLSAQHAIDYRSEDVVARVRELTGGRGADLILDPIGGKGFGRNFDMLAPLGMVVSYGRLDGPPDADLLTAIRANSAKSPAVRFFTIHSFDDRPDIRAAAMTVLLDHLAAGRIRPLIHDRLPLAEAGRAQALLESGQVIGKLLLKP